MRNRILLALALAVMAGTGAEAKVKLAEVFTNCMVLQQGKPLAVWGTADAGEQITLRIANRKVRATAGSDGRWRATVPQLAVSAKPVRFTVSGKSNRISLSNVLVGEVWLASGQSNMEYSMNNPPRYAKPKKGDPDRLLHEYESAANPMIRIMYVAKNLKADTLPTPGWQMVGRESLKPFSAPAYFFAKCLQDSLKVPVGIIASAWGGTDIETWTPIEMYQESKEFGPRMDGNRLRDNSATVGNRYRKMIEPIAPMALRGMLWYQGETNLINGDTDIYEQKMKLLVEGWRKAWADPSLPFYYVQISPMAYSARKDYSIPKTWQDLPRFWDAQTRCMASIPNTGMVVTTDIPESLTDIHPPYKWIVGERLAKWALCKTYGRTDVLCSGPVVSSARVEGDSIVVDFSNTGTGLATADGKAPTWVYVRNKKNRYSRAKAHISGHRLYVSAKDISPKPVIRINWDEVAQSNIVNSAGLPVVPFSGKVEKAK